MKKVELLFPELCHIYGERFNADYIARCNSEIQLIETNHKDAPLFTKEDVDMVYMGCASERKQEEIISILKPYKDRIGELIDKGTVFMITGNAIEVFGERIIDDGREIPALGLFPFESERFMYVERHNSQYIGTFTPHTDNESPLTLLGHRSQFSFGYGQFDDGDFPYFLDIVKGIGMNSDTKKEGIHFNNFFATYSLGPFFILNPLFVKYLLRTMGLDDSLAFEEDAIKAYEYRLEELR